MKDEDIFFVREKDGWPDYRNVLYNRALSLEARAFKFQYLSMEEELGRAFQYVTPVESNASAHSVKFAEIIRTAANTFEMLARTTYGRLYSPEHKIDIHNYLALDAVMKFSNRTVASYVTTTKFMNHPEVAQPFAKLATWDKKSSIKAEQIPDWWSAYNRIKHSIDGLSSATLANAIAAVGAAYIFIHSVFGPGVVSGPLPLVAPGLGGDLVPASSLFFPL
jgi:hypothetical protein